jgi:hypothetical protein
MALTPEDSKAVSKAIQDAMSAAVKSLGGGPRAMGGGASNQTDRNQKITDDRARKTVGKDKVILASAASLKKFDERVDDASGSLKTFTTTTDKSNVSLGNLRRGLVLTSKTLSTSRSDIRKIDFSSVANDISKAVTDSISAGKIDVKPPSAGPAVAAFAELITKRMIPRMGLVSERFDRLGIATKTATRAMIDVIGELREIGVLKQKRGLPGSTNQHEANIRPARETREEKSERQSQEAGLANLRLQEENKKLEKAKERRESLNEPSVGMGDAFEKAFKRHFDDLGADAKRVDVTFGKLAVVGSVLHKIFNSLISNGIEVLDDMFHKLAARGYGTSDSLWTLYKGAANAGMTLRDYAQFMDENMIAVSRASSFTAFQASMKTSTDALQKFGVFGEDALKLAGAMASSSTALGVPQAQMGEAMSRQLGVFEKLRKTTNITADEFAQMTKQLGEDAQVRTELSALDPKEAAMRQAAILDQMSYARSLNLSTSEVQKYTQAILEQRKSTVKQRFQQAGRLTQAAGLLGMGGQQTEELRSLSLNRYKTDDQQKRYMELLGQVNTGLETMQQQGGPGSQYQSDTIREMLDSSGLSQALEAASAIRAGKQSGPVKNQDIGKQLGSVAQGLGDLSVKLDGWMKNPFGQFAATFVGGVASITGALLTFNTFAERFGIMAGTTIAKILGKSGLGGATDLPPGSEGPTSGKGKWAGRAATGLKVAGGLAVAGIGAAQAYGAYQDYQAASKAQEDDTEDPVEARKKKIQAGTAGVFSGISTIGGIAMMLSPFLGPAAPVALAAGGIASAIGAFGGMFSDTIGGWISKIGESKAAEEKNTKAVMRATKVAEKTLRDGMPTDTILVDQLGNLTSNLIQTGQALRLPTVGERDQRLDQSKTRKQLEDDNAPAIEAERKKATPDQIVEAQKQAISAVTAALPEGKTVPQTKDIDAKREEILQNAAFERMMAQRRKDQTSVSAMTSYVGPDGTIVSGPLANSQSKSQPSQLQNTGINGPQTTQPNPLTNYSGLPYNPYALNKPPSGSAFNPSDPRTQTAITAAAAAATASSIATPTTAPPKSVNPGTVNTGEKDAKADADRKAAATQAATALAPSGAQDPADVLKQILDILKQSLLAENQQVDLTGQILRSQALMPTLPDKAAMYQQTARQ